MSDQYIEKQCDICHQLFCDGSPMVVIKCQHRYHRKCLPSNGEINDTKCPICPDENKLLPPVPTREADDVSNE